MRAFTPTYYLLTRAVTLFLGPFFSFPPSFSSSVSPLTLHTPAVSRVDALPSYRGSVFPGVFRCCLQQEGTHSPKYARTI